MPTGTSAPFARRRLGAALRRLRESAGMTGEQVIDRVGWASASKLSRIENGRSRADLADILDLLDLYQVDGAERDELIASAREAGNSRGWLRAYPVMTARQRGYAELESGCVHIREFSPAIVPGLLQTAGYARVRILSSSQLMAPQPPTDPEVEIAARQARASILTRPWDPPRYDAIIDEAALTARAGPTEVLAEQLAHLRRLGSLSHVTVRILPRDAVIGDWYVPQAAFSLYRFADPADLEAVAVETLGDDSITSDKSDVRRYRLLFEWLSAAALSTEQSLTWLRRPGSR